MCQKTFMIRSAQLRDSGLVTWEPRPGHQHLVWITELYDPSWTIGQVSRADRSLVEPSTEAPPRPLRPVRHRETLGAFGGLQETLEQRTEDAFVLTLDDLDELVDGGLPAEARTGQRWWSNGMRKRWELRGWNAHLELSLNAVRFTRSAPAPALGELRKIWMLRRHAAITTLTSPSPRTRERRAGAWDEHNVYQLHFPDAGLFKVGLTHARTVRVRRFLRGGGILVDQFAVANLYLAQIVEADALSAVEPWHQLASRSLPGSGYTEMWADSGPTVDLRRLAEAAVALVEQVRFPRTRLNMTGPASQRPRVRGRVTRITRVPATWRGPLPDPSVERRLDDHGGYAAVPEALLRPEYPDLGIITWAHLRLTFDDRAHVASYRDFADTLGCASLTDGAVEQRFGAALKPLLGKWIVRTPAGHSRYKYRAVVPSGSYRYAMLRRRDFSLLTSPNPTGETAKPSDLANFARWQLTCGRRGWDRGFPEGGSRKLGYRTRHRSPESRSAQCTRPSQGGSATAGPAL